jgi:hypothetical protein
MADHTPTPTPDHSYDVSAEPTPDGGVHVTIQATDTTIEGGSVQTVDLGEFPDHAAAAEASSTWVATDLGVFSIFGR